MAWERWLGGCFFRHVGKLGDTFSAAEKYRIVFGFGLFFRWSKKYHRVFQPVFLRKTEKPMVSKDKNDDRTRFYFFSDL
jgi:hypothetical protein